MAVVQAPRLGTNFVGASLQEQSSEKLGRRIFQGHPDAAAGPGQTIALSQGQAGEAGFAAQVLGSKLVQRNGVAKPSLRFGMWGGGQEADFGDVAAGYVRMRQTRHYRKVVPELFEDLQILGGLIVLARLFGEELRGLKAELIQHAHQAVGSGFSGPSGSQALQPGEGQRNARSPQELSSMKLHEMFPPEDVACSFSQK